MKEIDDEKRRKEIEAAEKEERRMREEEIQREQESEEEKAAINSMIVTTLCYLEDKRVVKYFDIITKKSMIARGIFLQEDIYAYADRAEGEAILEIKKEAHKLGANAILGVGIGYSAVQGDAILCSVIGTPVILEDKQ